MAQVSGLRLTRDRHVLRRRRPAVERDAKITFLVTNGGLRSSSRTRYAVRILVQVGSAFLPASIMLSASEVKALICDVIASNSVTDGERLVKRARAAQWKRRARR